MFTWITESNFKLKYILPLIITLISCSKSSDLDTFEKLGMEINQTDSSRFLSVHSMKEPEIGDRFRDIQGLNSTGQPIALSSLKGKFILLDFWASWCGPCRKENPNLLNLYRRYNALGFEIFNYSVDKNESQWKMALMKDSLGWTNVIEQAQGNNYPSVEIYKIQFLPTSYLINSKGIIIAKNLRGYELEEKLKVLLEE